MVKKNSGIPIADVRPGVCVGVSNPLSQGYYLIVLECPFCGKGHLHDGGKTLEDALNKDGATVRSQCGKRDYTLRVAEHSEMCEYLVRPIAKARPWLRVDNRNPLRPFKYYYLEILKCPFCRKRHNHGGGETLEEALNESGETRASHCGNGDYVLKVIKPRG